MGKIFGFGVLLHICLMVVGGMCGCHSLSEFAVAMSDNPIIVMLCWVPAICYLITCIIIFFKDEWSMLVLLAVGLMIGIPVLTWISTIGFWAFIAFGIAMAVLFAIGVASPLVALVSVLYLPGMVIGALCAIAGVAFIILDSFLFFF